MLGLNALEILSIIINNVMEVLNISFTEYDLKKVIVNGTIVLIAFPVVGIIFSVAKKHNIWFGKTWGKIIYFAVSSGLVWVLMRWI